jgi:hypothetical protein
MIFFKELEEKIIKYKVISFGYHGKTKCHSKGGSRE